MSHHSLQKAISPILLCHAHFQSEPTVHPISLKAVLYSEPVDRIGDYPTEMEPRANGFLSFTSVGSDSDTLLHVQLKGNVTE